MLLSTKELFLKFLERLEQDYNPEEYDGNLIKDVSDLLYDDADVDDDDDNEDEDDDHDDDDDVNNDDALVTKSSHCLC